MIKIRQTKTPEKVSSKIVSKLYDISKKNESDNNSDLFGYVQSTYGYQKECTYLKNKFLNFDIDILSEYYKDFIDPYCKQFWANTPIGDGVGVRISEFNKLNVNWGERGTKYGIASNNNYFGVSMEEVMNHPENVVQLETLKKIEHFPELVDLPKNSDDNLNPGDYYLPITQCLINIYELYCPKTSTRFSIDSGTYNNLTLLDMSTSNKYIDRFLRGPARAEHLSKIVCPPSITEISHGAFTQTYQAASGINIFFYAKFLNYVEASTWTLNGIRNAIFWVQDSAYEDWLNHPQIKAKQNTGYFVVKKLSEYTGTDLVKKYIYTADLFDILYSNNDGEYYKTSQVLPTSQGYTPIALCVAKTGFFGPNEPARWMALKNMDYTTPDTGDVSQYPKSVKFGNYNVLIEDVEDITMMYENCTDETVYPYTDYQTNTVNMPNVIDSNGDWNISELGTVNMYALTDIDGKSKTYKYINLATAQSDWKTDETITNNSESGYFPAACVCWRYHTKGTYQGSWYLPALGEIMMVVQYKTQINTILNQIHTLYPNDCMYYLNTSGGVLTSTEKNKTGVYRINLSSCDITATLKSYNGCGIMAFLKF